MAGRKGFDLDLADGVKAENDLFNIITATGSKVEVKRDFGAQRTGNVYIELTYRGQPSGLTTTEAEWWAIFLSDSTCVLTQTSVLREKVYSVATANGLHPVPGGDNDWSQGVLLPVTSLVREMI